MWKSPVTRDDHTGRQVDRRAGRPSIHYMNEMIGQSCNSHIIQMFSFIFQSIWLINCFPDVMISTKIKIQNSEKINKPSFLKH